MSNKIITLTDHELDAMLRKATREAVHETLLALGLDTADPLEAQADFRFMRDTREATETIKRNGMFAMIILALTAGAGMLWVGFKNAILPP